MSYSVPKPISTDSIVSVVASLVIIALAVAGLARGCLVEDAVAIRTLQSQGFSNVKIRDRAIITPGLHGCASDDAVAFTCVADKTNGHSTDVIVCAGWPFKAATIRYK